ncbi:MAG: NUDIX hydrolase [Candidatus Saganbacteria bacterium]|nr:NUDIX hydrolase [Candidatus Saganbacteria bacterium]
MKKTRLIHRAKIFDVVKKRVKLPNGNCPELVIIEHPGAVLVVPFLNDNEIVMIRQYRPAVERFIWELPAGTLEKGESPVKCAKRELIEEIGYCAKKIVHLYNIIPAPGYSSEILKYYAAFGLKKVKKQSQNDEVIREEIFNKKQIRKMFESGKIVDSKTITALAIVGWL